MRHHERAINEQLRTFISPEPGLAESQKQGSSTFAQKTGFRRRAENIMIAMIDNRAKDKPIQLKRVRGPHRRAEKRRHKFPKRNDPIPR